MMVFSAKSSAFQSVVLFQNYGVFFFKFVIQGVNRITKIVLDVCN